MSSLLDGAAPSTSDEGRIGSGILRSMLRVIVATACFVSSTSVSADEAVDRMAEFENRMSSIIENDVAGRRALCGCVDFDFGAYFSMSSNEVGIQALDEVRVWLAPSSDYDPGIEFPFRNHPLHVFARLGIPVSYADQADEANFKIHYADEAHAGLVGSDSFELYSNDQCSVWSGDAVVVILKPTSGPRSRAQYHSEAMCIGNAFLIALGSRPFLEDRDVYPVRRVGDAPAGTILEFNNGSISMRAERRVRCLTIGHRVRRELELGLDDYLSNLERFQVRMRTADPNLACSSPE